MLATLYVAPGGAATGPGSTSSPFGSIQAAVSAANSGDEIRVAAGGYTYDPGADHFGSSGQFSYTSALSGATPVVGIIGKQLAILGGFSTSNWAFSDPVANPTIIDGQGTHRGVFVLGTNPTSLTLSGFTIQNTLAQGLPGRSGADAAFAFGGGVFVDMGGRQGEMDPYIFSNLVFHNDHAVANGVVNNEGGRGVGGAVALRYVPNATFNNVVFDGNQAIGADGPSAGGGALGGAMHIDHSTITGDNLTFTNNLAQGGNSGGSGSGSATGEKADALGGALAVQSGSTASLTHVVATGNTAKGGTSAGVAGGAYGGALYVEGPNASLSVTSAYIQGNLAQGGNSPTGGLVGGGALEAQSGSVALTNVVLVGNTALSGSSTNGGPAGAAGGGALYLTQFTGSVTDSITNTVISDNSANLGSGTGNNGGGGGLWVQGVTMALNQVTFDNNHIDPRLVFGQSILLLSDSTPAASNVTVNNSILSDNTDTTPNAGAVEVFAGNTITFNTVLFFNNTNVAGLSLGTLAGLAGAPQLTPSAQTPTLYNAPGGPHWDYHLNRNVVNPAIDAAFGSPSTTDADGNPRVNVPDLGAYEAVNPRVEFAGPVSVGAGGLAHVTIQRLGDLSQSSTVDVTVGPGGSAIVGSDYQDFPGGVIALTFAPYESTKTITLQTQGNAGASSSRTVNLALALDPGSTSTTRLGNASTTVAIVPSSGAPISSGFAVTFGPISSSKGVTGANFQFNAALSKASSRAIGRAFFLAGSGRKSPKVAGVRFNARGNSASVRFSSPIPKGTTTTISVNPALLTDASGRPLGGTTTFTIMA